MKPQSATFPFGVRSGEVARGVLDNLIEGCQVVAPDWTYLYVNHAAAAQVQLPEEHLLGRSMLECLPDIEGTPMFDVLRRCMRERRPDRILHEFCNPHGFRGWFELRFVPTPDGVCIFSVECAQQRGEDAGASQARARALCARAPDPAARGSAPIDLGNLVRLVAGDYDTLAREKGVTFTVEAADAVPALVDAEKVRRLLSTLLSNAFSAVPSPGAVRVSLLSDKAHAFFEVADSGAGVPLEQRGAIFERSAAPGEHRNLSTARELALQQGGSIAISEAPEGGALIVVALPRGFERPPVESTVASTQPPLTPRAGASSSPKESERPLVLVIEDDVQLSRLIAKHLAARYRVATAGDGREGLRKVFDLQPDLILTDTVLPSMTGEELVHAVRKSPELSSIPILVLSAIVDDDLRVKLLRSGAQDYVTKPFAMAELRVRIGNLVKKKLAEEQVRRAAEDHNLLAEFGADLAGTLDYDETRHNVALLSVRALADFCILEMLDQNGEAESRKVANRQPVHASLAARLERWPVECPPRIGCSVFEAKERLLLNDVSPRYLESSARTDEQRATLRELAPRAILSLPLRAHGQLLGSLVLIRTGATQPFTSRDVALADGLAWRAALALDNARLYRGAQHAVQMRDDILSMVAHDLRNPLNAMLLQLHLLRRRSEEPERRSQEPVDAILREGARLDRLIGDLLDVARIEAGRFMVNRDSLRLKDVARDAFVAASLLAEDASLSLVLDEGDDTELRGDRFRLLQALGNLLGNAIKFSAPGGTVTLAAHADPAEVRISVIDSGPGIPAEYLPHLFDRFWQAKRADSRGAGLGLWIARTIAEAHGGEIRVESTLGRGSTFALTLPRGPSPAQNLR